MVEGVEDVLVGAENRKLAAGEHLLRAGERARFGAVVTEGLVREYYLLPDGRERTRAFAVEGELAGSLADLIRGEPAQSFSVAVAPTELVLVPWSNFGELANSDARWLRFSYQVLEHFFLEKSKREYELLALDAEARYRVFLERYPKLEARVKQAHVASYVGVTPEHLSRLRSKLRKSTSR